MSVMLDVAIGLVLIFLIFSIVVSGVNEWFAQAFARRGFFLRLGLQRLINDEAIYRRVLHHPLIGSLYRERAAQGKPPSYVEASNFVLALADVLLARANAKDQGNAAKPLSIEALRGALRAPVIATSPIGVALMPILDRAGTDLQGALKGIEDWFNSAMDRVGGWYKARTQKILFVIGFVIAVLCNVDTIEIVSTLSHSTALRTALDKVAESTVTTGKIGDIKIAELRDRAPTPAEWNSLWPVLDAMRSSGGAGLPVGYACLGASFVAESADARSPKLEPWPACVEELRNTSATRSISQWLIKLAGWLLTALAGTLGAAYWFSLLSKVVDLRGAGRKPSPQAQS